MGLKKFKEYVKRQTEVLGEQMGLKELTAKDAMIKPITLYEDDSLEKIIKKLKSEYCDVCIVVGKNGKFLGEIEDYDIVRIMALTALNDPVTSSMGRCYKRGMLWKKAGELAVRQRNTVSESTPINEVLKIIYKNKRQNVVVIGKEGKVAGVITLSSLISLLSRY